MSDFDPRRAEPGQTFTWHDEWGKKHNIHADADGVVRPANQAEADAADAFGLPVARKVLRAERAETRDTDRPAPPAQGGLTDGGV